MTQTINDDMKHDELVTSCIEKLDEIGATFAKAVFSRLAMRTLAVEDLGDWLDGVVEEARVFFIAGGVCEHDTEVACSQIRSAIIREGRRLAVLTPVSELVSLQ